MSQLIFDKHGDVDFDAMWEMDQIERAEYDRAMESEYRGYGAEEYEEYIDGMLESMLEACPKCGAQLKWVVAESLQKAGRKIYEAVCKAEGCQYQTGFKNCRQDVLKELGIIL